MKNNTKIQLASTDTCTGCAACASVCPTGSIFMKEDREGFLQPQIDAKTCIGCHKCEKTCPILNPIDIQADYETKFYAAQLISKEELLEVSSGGTFWGLAQSILEEGGIVYGAAQVGVDDVRHIRVDSLEQAKLLRRSKYLPSDITGIYDFVNKDLNKVSWNSFFKSMESL